MAGPLTIGSITSQPASITGNLQLPSLDSNCSHDNHLLMPAYLYLLKMQFDSLFDDGLESKDRWRHRLEGQRSIIIMYLVK